MPAFNKRSHIMFTTSSSFIDGFDDWNLDYQTRARNRDPFEEPEFAPIKEEYAKRNRKPNSYRWRTK